MGESFKYTSPWEDQEPTDPQEREKAGEAFRKLMMHFFSFPQQQQQTVGEKVESIRRLYETLGSYFSLSTRAAADGKKGGEMKRFVKEGLIERKLIDTSDPAKAEEEFTIISEGYELNRKHWDKELGRLRRFRNDLKDMRNETRGR